MELEQLFWQPCATRAELRRWLDLFLGLKLPERSVCECHVSPMEYVCRAYFEPSADAVIWGPRGGGKTRLGAAVTLLDMIHKPGTQIRILGGSLEQSLKMWHHLQDDIAGLIPDHVLKGRGRTLRLDNGSAAAVLTQSQKAVRGLRVQKLRCDEIELFDKQVWTAAQLVTQSRDRAARARAEEAGGTSSAGCGRISGVVEAMSTFHRPWGLMSKIVKEAEERGKCVLKWCLMEVLEKCSAERACASCPLWEDCRGRAKTDCSGFFKIDDAIAMKKRVSTETWAAEMMCKGVKVEGAVFGNFDPAVHVREKPETGGQWSADELWLGIDFGYANPFVCLWIFADEHRVFVADEYVQSERTVDQHLRQIEQRPWIRAVHLACDPAGSGRNEQTADSNIGLLRRAGYRVHARGSRIVDGVEKIRQYLCNGQGEIRLRIHPRCQRLIRAMQCYRYGDAGSELPLKDGEHDHLIDALRYFFINWQTSGKVKTRLY
jgi:hypothetical protein